MSFKKILIVAGLAIGLWQIKALAVWDTSTPAGSESKSMGDDRIRELKTDLQATFQHEGDFPGSDTSNPRFIFTPSTGTTIARPTGNNRPVGKTYINSDTTGLELWNGSSWVGQDLVQSSSITASKLATSVAGSGLGGGAGSPLHLQYNANLFSIASDTLTIVNNSIGSTQLDDIVDFSLVNMTAGTWSTFAMLPILQIQVGTTGTSGSTTSGTYSNTNLSVSITPKMATSKILVFANGTASVAGAANLEGLFTIARSGTNLASIGNSSLATVQAGAPFVENLTMFAYDSPGTTSALTYSVQYKTEGGNTAEFPTSAFGATGVPVASIIVVEIAQ